MQTKEKKKQYGETYRDVEHHALMIKLSITLHFFSYKESFHHSSAVHMYLLVSSSSVKVSILT